MTKGSRNLFIDIETIGFPEKVDYYNYHNATKFDNLKYYDTSRIIEIAFMIYDEKRNIIKSYSSLIKLDNFTIKNTFIHGITDEDCNKNGKDFKDVLNELINDIDSYDNIIAHNISFDYNILLSEIYRIIYNTSDIIYENKIKDFLDKFENKNRRCTMEIGRIYLKTKKSPKLIELYQSLFNEPIIQDHRALSDTDICCKCFYKMMDFYENDYK